MWWPAHDACSLGRRRIWCVGRRKSLAQVTVERREERKGRKGKPADMLILNSFFWACVSFSDMNLQEVSVQWTPCNKGQCSWVKRSAFGWRIYIALLDLPWFLYGMNIKEKARGWRSQSIGGRRTIWARFPGHEETQRNIPCKKWRESSQEEVDTGLWLNWERIQQQQHTMYQILHSWGHLG